MPGSEPSYVIQETLNCGRVFGYVLQNALWSILLERRIVCFRHAI